MQYGLILLYLPCIKWADMRNILVICSGRFEAKLLLLDLLSCSKIDSRIYDFYIDILCKIDFERYGFFIGFNENNEFGITSVKLFTRDDLRSCHHFDSRVISSHVSMSCNLYGCRSVYPYRFFHVFYKSIICGE